MAISDVCPPPLYIKEILILERREIQNQMREIQIPTGEEEVTYGHFRRLPPPLYILEMLILQMREIQRQIREIQIATGGEEVTYGHFRRLPPPPPLYIGVIH